MVFIHAVLSHCWRSIDNRRNCSLGAWLMSYVCATCNQKHEEVPLSFVAEAPYLYDVVALEERDRRTELSSD